MADFCDRAAILEEMERADALTRHRRLGVNRASAETCEECGEAIPEARRLSAPGCCRCTDCQKDIDREKARQLARNA